MPLKNTKFLLQSVVTFVVAALIAAALTLSGLAVVENVRFINATNQLSQLVRLVRSTATGQKDFAQTIGENIFADLQHQGQILPSTITPWGGNITATLTAPNMMRVDVELPTSECRRMALHFMDFQPADTGIMGLQAQAPTDTAWVGIYPLPPQAHIGSQLATACGQALTARLGILFQIR